MALLEYIGYVLLYGYVVFGAFYIVSMYFSLNQSGESLIALTSLGVGDLYLSHQTLIALDFIFKEIGVQSIEFE